MANKTIVFIGITSYILGVLSSAEDLNGNFISPSSLVIISGIVTLAFVIMATVRLWKVARYVSVALLLSEIILIILTIIQEITLPKYGSPIIILLNVTKVFHFLTFIYAIFLLWAMGKHEGLANKLQKDSGLTSEEFSTMLKEKQKGNEEEAKKILISAQERSKTEYKEITGIDPKILVPEIGKEISWADIVKHVFRVLEFDRNGTTINQNNKVKAKSSFQPYGYLLAESPILNNEVRIPIIHRDDFLLASSVFDEPKLVAMVNDGELLVTYAPKYLLPKGFSGSPHHVLHYVIAPCGTLDSYYSKNNDMYMAKPEPQILFGTFVYQGEIKVQINSEPKL